jgi:hypothetical protein
MIEVQGYCADPLASLSFDLSNASGFFPNQPAFVLSHYFDTNVSAVTTNTFQAFDVPLTNGINVLTFHATDLAGNVTTTNFIYTLDYSAKTNPPVMQIYWPQDGDNISGSTFTLRGSVDDFTATLTAQIIDSSGNTNTIQGLVERNGLFWVENAPFLPGTNYVTLTAADAVGNTSTTNLIVNDVSSALTVNNFSSELGGPYGTPAYVLPAVAGTTTLGNVTLWVNGVEATQSGSTWQATSVPIGSGGTAIVDVTAIPNSDNNGNGSGAPAVAPSNPGSPNGVSTELDIDEPPISYVQETQYNGNWSSWEIGMGVSSLILQETSRTRT